jgi:hypothetical protein
MNTKGANMFDNQDKTWVKPKLVVLDFTKTANGDIDNSTEGSWFIFTWGS